jgi:uncharacterized protein (TIGR03435 family)
MLKQVVVMTALAMIGANAQTRVPPALSFDAATVKANPVRGERAFRFTPERVDIVGATLAYIVSQAYETPIPRTEYPGGPMKDLFSRDYDIHAVAARPSTRPELLLMLQQLLRDRFSLAVHTEARVGPAYNLVAARGGPKLRASSETFEGVAPAMALASIEGRASSMGQLAFLLTARMGRPVLDRTGLTGRYDFTLSVERLDEHPGRDQKSSGEFWSESSIFTDLQEQLGLRLEATRSAVDYLVIDGVQAPAEN